MPTIISNGGSRAIRKPTLAEFNFQIELQEQTVVIEQQSTTSTIDGDANVLRSTQSTIENRFAVGATQTAGDSTLAGITSVSALGAGIVSGGIVSRVNDGACAIIVSHPWLSRRADVTFARTGGQTADTFQSYRSGALAAHIKSQLESRATGKTAADIPVYNLQNHDGPSYSRNSNCWLANVNLTAVSPWNNQYGVFPAGTAISPRHVVFANHATVSNGTALRFITQDNQIVTRTVTATQSISEAEFLAIDIAIGVLDSDLPASITPVKVMPANVASYLPTISKYYIPSFSFDFEEKVISKVWSRIENDGTRFRNWFLNPSAAPLSTLSETIIGGDSGNPVFTLVNGEPVLLGCWAGVANGAVAPLAVSSALHLKINEVNAIMTSLGGGYQLNIIDLSGFNTYA